MLSDASSAPDPADVVKAAALKRGARIEVYREEELEYYVGTMTATRLVGTRKIRQHHVKYDVTTDDARQEHLWHDLSKTEWRVVE